MVLKYWLTKEIEMADGKNCLKRSGLFCAIILAYVFLTPFLFDLVLWEAYSLTSSVRYCLWNYLPWLILVLGIVASFRGKMPDLKLLAAAVLVWLVYFAVNFANGLPTDRLVTVSHRTMICLLGASVLLSDESRAAIIFEALDCLYIVTVIMIIVFKTIPAVSVALLGWEYDALLSSDNGTTWPLLFGALYAMLDHYYNGARARPAIYGFLLVAAEYFLWCATAMVGVAIIAVCLLPFIRRPLLNLKSEAIAVASVLLAAFFVFFFEKLCTLQPIRFLTDNVLKKDVSLTGRTIIWAGIRPLAVAKPLFGHGLVVPAFFMDEVYNHTTVHAHNFFLQAFYEGGLACIAAGIVMMLYCCRKVRKKNDKHLVFFLNVISIAMLVMLQSDQPAYWSWYPVMMLYGIMALLPPKNNGQLPAEGTAE